MQSFRLAIETREFCWVGLLSTNHFVVPKTLQGCRENLQGRNIANVGEVY